jgi:hypothetical protein
MCMRCCGRDHLGQCTEDAKCFVCAGEHEGSKHEGTAENCGKRSAPCEHHVAKCANCEGPHLATSPQCPERRSSRQTRQRKVAEMRSSPPAMETAAEREEDLSDREDQVEMEVTSTAPSETTLVQVIPISSDRSTPEPLPRSQPSSRPTRELRSRTRTLTRATQIPCSSDRTRMSVVNDSNTT